MVLFPQSDCDGDGAIAKFWMGSVPICEFVSATTSLPLCRNSKGSDAKLNGLFTE